MVKIGEIKSPTHRSNANSNVYLSVNFMKERILLLFGLVVVSPLLLQFFEDGEMVLYNKF
jgi:hypothetical protein